MGLPLNVRVACGWTHRRLCSESGAAASCESRQGMALLCLGHFSCLLFNEAVWVHMPLLAFCALAALTVKPLLPVAVWPCPPPQVLSPTPFPFPVPCHPCPLSPIPLLEPGKPFSCLRGPTEAVPCLEHLSSLCTYQALLFLQCSA